MGRSKNGFSMFNWSRGGPSSARVVVFEKKMVLGLGRHTPFLVGKDGSRQDSECELVLLEQAPDFPLGKAPPGVM